MNYEEKTITSETIYKGEILTLRKDQVMTPGGKSFREIIDHNGATGIVALDDNNNIIIVKQYRKAIESMLIEIPAGKLDEGENPLDCAKRELKEETGICAKKFTHLVTMLPAAGYSNEKLDIYLATDLDYGQVSPDDDEFLIIEKIHIDKLMKMISEGKIIDSKTIIGVLMVDNLLKKKR